MDYGGVQEVPAELPLSPAVSVAAGTTALDPCCLPPDSGPCDAIFKRWFHDCETGTCRNFTYGGCGGNANNFVTEGECRAQCGGVETPGLSAGVVGTPPPPTTSPVVVPNAAYCKAPPTSTPCPPGATNVYYFDAQIRTCRNFPSGECGSGNNSFRSREECLGTCQDEIPVCCRPAYTGPCRAAMSRWYFDCETGTCQRFIYGGCQSNGNNFATQQECLRSCQGCPPTPGCGCSHNSTSCLDCDGRTRCCWDPDCGSYCAAPVESHPGQCPPPQNILCFVCKDQCRSDGDCGAKEKCCLEPGCGRACLGPAKEELKGEANNTRCSQVPFPLTLRFKPMLQRGIELMSLDASWVSSASWYFLNVFGLRSIYALVLGENNAADSHRALQDQMSGAALAMPPDPRQAFKAEWEALEICEHRWALENAASELVA
ncbi:hypothetical protein LAZ67_11003605 [Cordylochernes scorpioides]|uniref:ER membrane protein complex subunit 3 n=2 Tax=Chelicerata TaxID=6843 RepID=A0ABY6L4U5_9ARAC|nr:hypothetical protein LAZ67_11003605 [Cordylochernes scorpioides]